MQLGVFPSTSVIPSWQELCSSGSAALIGSSGLGFWISRELQTHNSVIITECPQPGKGTKKNTVKNIISLHSQKGFLPVFIC